MKTHKIIKKVTYSLLIISLFTVGSCNSWLHVLPESERLDDDQFSTESGFQDALRGIYILLASQELYGDYLTWRMLDMLAQQYYLPSGMSDASVFTYSYATARLQNYATDIWLKQYHTIANINNILLYADQNSGVMHPVMDSVVKGECLALRAFCHLDLMRLYGKGNLANRPELADVPSIPYSKDFSFVPPKQYTNRETFQLLFADFEQAIKYLEADPIKSLDNRPEGYYNAVSNNGNGLFINATQTANGFAARRVRMNYYACLGLYARALMWEGSPQSKAKALELAQTVTNSGSTDNTSWYRWVVQSSLSDGNYLFNDNSFIYEHLWSLYVDQMWDYQVRLALSGSDAYRNWFNAYNPTRSMNCVSLAASRVNTVFESALGLAAIDWRYTNGLKNDGDVNYFAIVKYREEDPADNSTSSYHALKSEMYRKRMPLLRVSELYYIAAECLADSNPEEATRYLNVVRNHRNIPSSFNLQGLTSEQVKEEITKEYMKEFIAEGQLFYYYKRLGFPYILGYGLEMTDLEYVFPIPDYEIATGGRVPIN